MVFFRARRKFFELRRGNGSHFIKEKEGGVY